jgi:transposase
MNALEELTHINLDPGLKARLEEQFQGLMDHIQQLTIKTEQYQAQAKLDEAKIQKLTYELAHLRRYRFGKTSEALSAHQRSLFEETIEADIAQIESQIEALSPATDRPKKKPVGRQTLPPHLPRIEFRHEPASCQCEACGKLMTKIGEDISEQLNVEPAKFTVHRHIRPQYACPTCETVAAAPVPASVIEGGLGTCALHAWIIVQKYVDHLPLYRIEQISARFGVCIARSTQASWVGRIGADLTPLAARLAELQKQRRVLHADETPVPQLDPGSGKTKRAYLWAYRTTQYDTGPPIIVFDYQTSRHGRHANHFLNDWKGDLMVDDYAGYKKLFTQGIRELACLAHMRRKFFDLYAANKSAIAEDALKQIAELYRLEKEAQSMTVAMRHELRQTQAKPIIEAFHLWLRKTRTSIADGSATAKAIDYSLKRWPAFIRYLQDGLFPIDNNPVENAIRPIAIGKKNWLFVGAELAGKRAAVIQSLLGTAMLNGIEPYAWLKDTLEKLPTWLHRRIDAYFTAS